MLRDYSSDPADDGLSEISEATGAFVRWVFTTPSNRLEINAGDGDDTIQIETLDPGFAAVLDIRGEDGDDTIDASAYNLATVLSGGAGDDTLTGGTANDSLDGGEGNDVLDGGAGRDQIDGGGGNDQVAADADDGALTVSEDNNLDLQATFVADVSTAVIDWGDGTIEDGTVDANTVSGAHAYLVAGRICGDDHRQQRRDEDDFRDRHRAYRRRRRSAGEPDRRGTHGWHVGQQQPGDHDQS